MHRWLRLSAAVGAAALGGSFAGYQLAQPPLDYASSWTPWQRTLAASSGSLPQPFSGQTLMPSEPTAGLGLPGKSPNSRANEIARFGYPSFDSVRSFEGFVMSYDRRNRSAHWVLEHLTAPAHSADRSKVSREQCKFYTDMGTHPFFRATNEDYKGSGFDRGHLAAAGNHRTSQEACNQTFILSNIAPQVGKGFNRDGWNQLEKYVRGLTKSCAHVFVCTGPLYLPSCAADGHKYVSYRVIGANQVAVPTHFFKAALLVAANGQPVELLCWVMPNAVLPDQVQLQQFMVPPDAVERASGLLLFQGAPRNRLARINGRSVSGQAAIAG